MNLHCLVVKTSRQVPDPPFPIGHANGVNRLIDTIEDDSNEKNSYRTYGGGG